MAAAPTNYNINDFSIGPGTLWYFNTPPANGAWLALVGGAPDLAIHPDALCMGLTTGGATFKSNISAGTKIYADQIKDPIDQLDGDSTTTLTTTLYQVSNPKLLAILSPSQATVITGSGIEGVTYGSKPRAYISVALIYATKADPTKYSVIQVYKCFNTTGIDKAILAKDYAKTPVSFEGVAIPSRTSTDTTAIDWRNI